MDNVSNKKLGWHKELKRPEYIEDWIWNMAVSSYEAIEDSGHVDEAEYRDVWNYVHSYALGARDMYTHIQEGE